MVYLIMKRIWVNQIYTHIPTYYLKLIFTVCYLFDIIFRDYYDTKNNNYYIDSHYIIAGCFYITRQTTFPNTLKQWFRIKVLRFIDLTTVEVSIILVQINSNE